MTVSDHQVGDFNLYAMVNKEFPIFKTRTLTFTYPKSNEIIQIH